MNLSDTKSWQNTQNNSNLMTYMISYMRDRLEGGENITYADFAYVTMSHSIMHIVPPCIFILFSSPIQK